MIRPEPEYRVRLAPLRETSTKLVVAFLVFSFIFTPLAPAFAEGSGSQSNELQEISAPAEELTLDSGTPALTTETSHQSTAKADSEKKEELPAPQALLSGNENQSPVDLGKTSVNSALKLEPSTLDGSLSYQVPLVIPPGRNGLQPSLSLIYSSRPSQEANLFGHGWSVSIPYIERKNYTGSENLYSTSTAYYSSLSGDLATTTSASVFKAKVDDGSFLQYAFSTSTGWTVTDKRGTTYKFGTASSTQLVDPSNSAHVFRWMLQEVRDTNDNYISYAYTKDGNQIYPDVITYAGHAATPGAFDVHFTKELRNDIVTSTAEGFNVTTRYRISEIKAEVSDSWVRKYSLGYGTGDNGERDILTSITESGYDGVTALSLPTSTYAYQSSVKSWSEATTTWDIPVPTVESDYSDSGTRFADVNGDGLPDILRRDFDNSHNDVYINNGSGWTNGGWTIPVPITDGATVHPGTLLVDINGDGRIDIVRAKESATSSIYMNTGTSWALSSSTPPVNFSDSSGNDLGVRVADVNGDGLPDLLHNTAWDGNKVYINNGSGWTYDSSWTLPEVTAAKIDLNNVRDLGTRFADVNGDGLADVIRKDETVNKVYLQDGSHGWTLSSSTVPVELMDAGNDMGTRLEDINGDGLVDFINSQAVNDTGVYINNGASWTLDSSYSIPFKIVDFVSSAYVDPGTRLVDVDGDGLTDLLQYKAGGTDQVYLRNGPKPDLLATSTSPQGGITSVTYKGSPEYGTNPRLPLVLDTVEKITYDDRVGSTWDTEYAYEGGLYYATSSAIRDRKFAGFKTVLETDDLGFVTKSYFHQGDTSSSTIGEYDDHISKIGKVFRTESYDNSGNLYGKTINKWDRYDRGDGASFVKLAQSVDFAYDGDSDHKEKAESFTWSNSSGNLGEKIEWGVVTGSDDGTFTDAGTDKFTTALSYATSSTVSVLSGESTTDQSSVKIRERRIYYDGLSLGSVGAGNPTKEEQWKTGSTYIDTEKTYDSYGLVSTEKDPRDKTTTYAYDALNLYAATSTNPLSQATGRTYDYSSGKVTQVTDPNGRVFQTLYDSLDRIKEEKQPDLASPSSLVTKNTYTYTDTGFPTKVQKTAYLGSATSTDSYLYLDGFGRKSQERTESESSYAAKDYRYDSRGLLESESLPYFSSGTSYTATSTPTASGLLIRYAYDPLQRVKTITTAVGTTTNAYDDWKTTVTDPEGNVKDFTKDAYGNLVQVVEHNGVSSYTTAYEWSGNKKLTKLTDAEANVRNFTYDGLGRRLTAEDLHDVGDGTFGTWTYAYDDAGNMSSSTDPKSQTVTMSYDDLNRPLTENYTGAAGTEVTYFYDACTEGVGRLCAATSTAATATFAYNALGLVASETKSVSGTAYTTSYTYDRQGNQTNIVYPDNSEVKFSFNGAGQLENVAQKESGGSFANLVADFDYAPTGKVSHKEFGNGVTSDYTFDAAKLYRLDSILTMATSTGMGGGDADSIYWDGSHFLYFEGGEVSGADLDRLLALGSGEGETPEELVDLEAPLPEETPSSTTPGEIEEVPAIGEEPLIEPENMEAREGSEVSSTTLPASEEVVPETELVPELPTVLPLEEKPFLIDAPVGRSAPEKDRRIKSEFVAEIAPGVNSYHANVYANDVQYVDPEGKLADIDTTLVSSDGGWTMSKAPYAARLARDTGEKVITFRKGNAELYLSPAGSSSVVQGEKLKEGEVELVRYPNALGPGTDLEVSLDTTALRKDAVLRNKAAALKSAAEGYVELPFLLQSNEPIDVVSEGTSLSKAKSFESGEEAEVQGPSDTLAYLWAPVARDADGNEVRITIRYEETKDGIILTKRIPASWLESAAYPVRTDVVVSYYPDSGDGDAYKSDSSWSTAHSAITGTSASYTATTARAESKKVSSTYTITRAALPFDTSGLPDDAVIDSATLKVWLQGSWNQDNDGNNFVRVVQNTSANSNRFDEVDFDQVGAVTNPVAGAPDKSLNSTSDGQYNNFVLNATGTAWISKTGFTKLGLREGHDAVDNTIANSAVSSFIIYTANQTGTSTDPILEITYHVNNTPSAPTGLLAEGLTNPFDITDSTPEFSAVYEDPDSGDIATHYQIQVATSSAFASTYWDSTKTALASSTVQGTRINDISYAGPTLVSSTLHYWRIRFWDDENGQGAWSTATSTFTLAGGSSSSSVVQDMHYVYDNVGNITQLIDYSGTGAAKTVLFTYDDLNRLVSASTTAAASLPFSETYAYSAAGNITNKSDQGSYSYSETGTTNPQAATTIGSVSLAYDANGNLISMATSTYAWDWRNRLTTSTVSGATTTFAYDHTFERVKKTLGATSTIYANDLYNTNGTTKTKNVFAGGELVATIETVGATSTTRYIHTDHLGGVNAVTNASGTVVEVADYYPFGKQRIDIGASQNQRGFIGEVSDPESNLSYLNARYYDGARGQFTSQDPVFWELNQNLQNPQSLNSYAYANGNPISNKDPDGREAYSGVLNQPYYSPALNPATYAALATAGYGAVAVGSVAAVLYVGIPWTLSQPLENETTIPFVDPGQFQTGTIQLEKQGFNTPIPNDGNMPSTRPPDKGPGWGKVARDVGIVGATLYYAYKHRRIDQVIDDPMTINQTSSRNVSSNNTPVNRFSPTPQAARSSRSIFSQLSSALNQLSQALRTLQKTLR